nr:hypothetical protein [Tanacetum cinerariifolium]
MPLVEVIKRLYLKILSDDEDADERDIIEDDDCVKIPLITPTRSTVELPFGGNQCRDRSDPAVAEGSGKKRCSGKGYY